MEKDKELTDLLNQFRYAEAIEFCKKRQYNDFPIREIVHNEDIRANNELDQGNAQKAIDIYIHTIGVIEPSHVLCRFTAPHLTKFLTAYLIELHKRGYAKEPHTRLLFNMFHHEEERKHLSEFIEYLRKAKEVVDSLNAEKPSKTMKKSFSGALTDLVTGSDKKKKNRDHAIDQLKRFLDSFRADAAVETLKENDMDKEAMQISKIMQVSSQIVDLLINAEKKYSEAADMIRSKALEANNEEGKKMLFDFGPKLLRSDARTAEIIVETAIELWRQKDKNDETCNDRAFMCLFWGCPESAKAFLEKAVECRPTPLLVNSLIELVIPRVDGEFFGHPSVADGELALKYINEYVNPSDDISYLLFVCSETHFSEGTVTLLKQSRRNSEVAALYISRKMTQSLKEWILEDKPELGEDWIQILRYFASINDTQAVGPEFLKELVMKALVSRPLFSIISELCASKTISFDVVKHDVNRELDAITRDLKQQEIEHERLTQELFELEREIDSLEDDDIEFRPMNCDVCRQKLQLPYVGFFCKHNVCRSCCDLGMDGDLCCPICKSETQKTYTVPAEQQKRLQATPGVDLLDDVVALIHNGYFGK